ncbi:hypothetical protein [Faecalibacterium duncaniae]|uniref:hypothetical protein n=2 Tax=Faecalibacterium duncaniae (strain DSM 17677 / JCM 31915 / A2-165) TaxID=411483 RepID=UPI0005574599|nr:hypothetical protein [Faecalibacterium duncaniae]MDV5057291.1 hypothetical protein [Faecalibacterium duncaniae]QIA43175.1 hypothetical protein GXM22_08895 [Faecalibacterium duncaniae]
MSKKKECSNLETRTMNVTMSQDDFKKLDSGELRSNHGLRDSSGHIKASLDISYISENELSQREAVRTETVYKESPVSSPMAQALVRATGATMEIWGDILSDPEVKKSVSDLIHVLWHYKVQPKIQDTIDRIKGISQPQPPFSEQVFQTKAEQILSSQTIVPDSKDTSFEPIPVTNEQAAFLLAKTKESASELTRLIYLLSNIVVKDDVTAEEYSLEQSYIKELLSESSVSTMTFLLQNRQLGIIDDKTALLFSDVLEGYVSDGQQRIPLPIDKISNQ